MIAPTGMGATFVRDKTNSGEEMQVFSLDDYFKEQKVDFIKADIESLEYDMLCGAENIIKRDKPLLAVCIEHLASDMFTIPLLVKSMNSEYKLKVRHHSYCFFDTVLYAYI
ncbi:hypothetical protein FACS1894102_0530 [Spirochaetia bacterium]|nr:hypothetical protein FACS1894102_0530 [Spirochaetia bacterium]